MIAAGLMIATFILYFVLLEEKFTYFGEFKKKFAFGEWPQKYFNLIMLLRFISALILSFSWQIPFYNAAIIALALFQFCLICKVKPFNIPGRNIRPSINCILMSLIQVIFLLFSVI